MSTPDASLIPPGPPPLEGPSPIPEKRRLRWWMVALGTILVAVLVLGAGLALAAVLRDDGSPAASNRPPSIDLPGGLSGVAPPIDSIPDSIPGGSTPTTPASITPGASPTSVPGASPPTSAGPAPTAPNPPVTNRPPIGAGQIPTPTAPPRCAISSFNVDPDSVGARRNGNSDNWRLVSDVTVSFNGSAVCPSTLTIRILTNNRTTRTFSVSRNGSAFVYVINGAARDGWPPGDYIVQIEDRGQFKGALPLQVFCDNCGVD